MRSDTLFFAGFIPYLIHEMWKTTMFSRYIYGVRGVIFTFLCLGLMLLKVMLYDHFSVKQIIYSAVLLIVGALTYLGTGNILYVSLMVMVIAAKDVDLDKIIGVWLAVTAAIMLMALTASQLGIIDNLQYVSYDFFTGKKMVRNSFGIVYPTDCAAHIFFCVLSLFYLRRDYLKWYDFTAGAIAGFLVYYYCRAKLDALSILLAVVLFLAAFVFKKNKLWKKLWSTIGPWVTPAACMGMIVLTYVYKQNGPLERINKFISGRLFFGKAGMDEYGIPLLGQKLRLIGNGGTTDTFHLHYNFLDASYINMLVVSGMVFLTVFMLMYIMIGYIHRKNTFMLCALSLIAFNCAIAHHMTAVEYNIFTLALFAAAGKEHEN